MDASILSTLMIASQQDASVVCLELVHHAVTAQIIPRKMKHNHHPTGSNSMTSRQLNKLIGNALFAAFMLLILAGIAYVFLSQEGIL